MNRLKSLLLLLLVSVIMASATPRKDNFVKQVNSIQKVAGYFLVWCDYTAEHDASGKYLMEKSEGLTVPKCLESKAQKVNVDLN